ncbi:MAG: hypothetical protein LBK71_08985, partial [Verrucomicrobiales bacterium]|nr:hypothetical protein [Verrucomicrobiales bacterium]
MISIVLGLTMTVSSRAQWTGAFDADIANPYNYANGDVNFRFVYSGPEIIYDLGTLTFTNNETFTYSNAAVDGSLLGGYYIFGPNNELRKNAFVASVSGTTVTLGRGRVNTTVNTVSGTASNYGPTIAIPALTFDAGATVLYTGTYDARQLNVGSTVSAAGIPAGAYITGILNSGAVTISAPTTAAGAGVAGTQSGASTYGKAVNLTVSGSVGTADDFVYLNSYRGGNNTATINGSGTLFFNGPNTLFAVASGATSDNNLNVSVPLNFAGDVTFNVGSGYSLAYYADGAGPSSQLLPSTPILNLSGAMNVAGDVTKTGGERMKILGPGYLAAGGAFNIMDGIVIAEVNNAVLTDGSERIRGASAVNIVANPSSYRASMLILNGDQNGYAQATGTGGLLAKDIPVNLLGGALMAQGVRRAGDEYDNWLESTGTVNLLSGRNYLGFTGTGSGGRGYGLQLAALNRQNGATLSLYGIASAYGTVQLKVLNEDAITGDLVGSGTSLTSTAILPWAVAQSGVAVGNPTVAQLSAGNDLVTYVSGSGFRALAANEYKDSLASASADGMTDNNVSLAAAETFTGNVTVNALRGGVKVTGDSAARLTVSSGLLVASGNLDLNAGNYTISTGSRALIGLGGGGINMMGTTYVNDIAKGSKEIGLIAATSGNFSLGPGNFGGTVLVESGILVAAANNSIPVTSDVRIDTRASFNVQAEVTAASLAGSGTVLFQNNQRKLSIGGAVTGQAYNSVVVRNGGFIAPGDVAGPLQASALYFGANIDTIIFEAGSLLQLDLGADGVSDTLAIYNTTNPTKTLTFNDGAILQLNFLDGYTPQENDTWSLAAGFTTISEATGDWSKVLLQDAGGDDLSDLFTLELNNGSLLLTSVIPEPST